MRNACAALLLFTAATWGINSACAQTPGGGGKIYCWKNKTGKTECGDVIPYEYQESGIRELNQRGVIIRQTQPAPTGEQKKLQQAELDRQQAEQQRKEDQRRQDRALLDTFSHERDIDLKRTREMQLMEGNIEMLQNSLKAASLRQNDSRARINDYARRNAPVPPAVQDEAARSEADKAEIEKQIAQKRNELLGINHRYDELKKRYAELKGTAPAAQPPAAAPRK
jgi:hypothetical protein